MRRAAAILAVGTLVLLGCDNDTAKDVGERAKEVAGTIGARAAAEAMRASLKTRNLEGNETVRDVTVLKTAADDIPGDPDVGGITDTDGDGKDDDGHVEIRVGDQKACLTVEENGNVGVDDGACPASPTPA